MRFRYLCADGESLNISTETGPDAPLSPLAGRSIIAYKGETAGKPQSPEIFVSGTQLSRDMAEIVRGPAGLATITFPRTVRKLGRQAFNKLGSLRSVVPSDGLAEIGEYALCGTRIVRFALPPGVGELREGTFWKCGNLKHVTLNGSLRAIKDKCFSGSGIADIAVPASVANIGAGAFSDCRSLERVQFQEGCRLAQIRSSCFQGSDLREVTLPAAVRQIAKNAFKDCALLQGVRFQKGSRLEKVDEGCFEGSGLRCISIPASVKTIRYDASSHCDALKRVSVEDGCQLSFSGVKLSRSAEVTPVTNAVDGARLAAWHALRDVSVPDGIKHIGSYWFFGSAVESVSVPASVVTIGVDAFCRCESLKRVTFARGSAVQRIGDGCFYDTGLEEIELPGTLASVGRNAFSACRGLRAAWLDECGPSVSRCFDQSVAILPQR